VHVLSFEVPVLSFEVPVDANSCRSGSPPAETKFRAGPNDSEEILTISLDSRFRGNDMGWVADVLVCGIKGYQ